jgi:S-adenosylmethionine uptake transporter
MHALWMVVAGLAFALMGVFVKRAATEFTVAEIVLYRALGQMAVGWALLAATGATLRTARFGMHVHRGVAGFVSMFMFFYALSALPVATAITLNYTSPLFLVVLLAWLARERPSATLVGAVIAGFVGVVLLLRPAFGADQLWPGLVGLASGMLSSAAYWNVRELVRAREPEGRVVFYFGLIAAFGSLVWMAPQRWHPLTTIHAWDLVAVAAFGAAGQVAMTRAYGKGSTIVAAALSYSSIVFSSILGVLIVGDRLGWASWIGMLLIVAAGIIAVQLQLRQREAARPRTTSE